MNKLFYLTFKIQGKVVNMFHRILMQYPFELVRNLEETKQQQN